MKFEEWQECVPKDITADPLWKLDVYCLGVHLGDLAWEEALTLSKTPLTRDLANQLYRAVCSRSANIAEGYTGSTGPDRARFLEYALGSAREARDWYYKSRHVLNSDKVAERIALLTQTIKELIPLTVHQRKHGLREQPAAYEAPDELVATLHSESESS